MTRLKIKTRLATVDTGPHQQKEAASVGREAQDPASPAGCGATQPPPTTVSQTADRARYLQNLPA